MTRVRGHPGARITYVVAGDGPPVVLIHGWACRRGDFAPIIDDLACDYRVLALDLPWHGDSTSHIHDWPMVELGALVAAVAADEGMRDCALVGHSMGAAVAVEAMLAGAGHRVVALDGLTFMHMYPRLEADAADQVLAPFRADLPGAVRALCRRAGAPGTDALLLERIADEMGQIDPRAGVEMLAALLDWDMDAALTRVDERGGSITALAARALLSPAAVDRYGHRFQICPVDLGGHFYLREDPAGTTAAIRAVLSAGSPND